MKASVRWLNSLLEGAAHAADKVEALLTDAGFPIDARESIAGDARLEVEVTSNRGDCLSHVGLAREIGARTGQTMKIPAPPTVKTAGAVVDALRLANEIPESCPRFTVHVIRGITIKPSPEWLAAALESVGQRPISNIVDVTNYINFLFGQPAHAFDLAKLAEGSLVVRMAREGESLTTLDGKARKLHKGELVVADAERAQSLAGIIGGQDSEVGPSTRDVVLEAATWDPVVVRRAARRHQIRTDAGHRFERGVDPRTIDLPARLAAALIADLGGGTLCAGMLDAGRPVQPLRTVSLRTDRCRALLGIEFEDSMFKPLLSRLGIEVERQSGGVLACRIPAHRLDLEREVDLIEEVARVHGLDSVPIHDRISVAVRPPQNSESAIRRIGDVLSGLGFFETVTFSFVTPKHAAAFMPAGHGPLAVNDDRRDQEGTLRPSTIPSLLLCRRTNSHAGVWAEGGVRLFETAAAFSEESKGKTAERRTLALIMDIPGVAKGKPVATEERQRGVRLLRGAVEAVIEAVGGNAHVTIRPEEPRIGAFDRAAHAAVILDGQRIGSLGLMSEETLRLFDLPQPVAAAELDLDPLVALYPPRVRIVSLPAFPSIERDLSLIVEESTPWASIHAVVSASGVSQLEGVSFIGTYRGKQIGENRKSVTIRIRFRDPARTLRHEEVDPQMAAVVALAGKKLGATLRV